MDNYCENGKIIHATHKAAGDQIKSLAKRKNGHKYSSYKCELCGGFHITTITKCRRVPEKIDKYPIEYKREGNIPEKKKKKK